MLADKDDDQKFALKFYYNFLISKIHPILPKQKVSKKRIIQSTVRRNNYYLVVS